MAVTELKKLLIHRIAEIDDVSFLNAIKTILDTKTQSQTLTMTAEQRFEVQESRKEIVWEWFDDSKWIPYSIEQQQEIEKGTIYRLQSRQADICLFEKRESGFDRDIFIDPINRS